MSHLASLNLRLVIFLGCGGANLVTRLDEFPLKFVGFLEFIDHPFIISICSSGASWVFIVTFEGKIVLLDIRPSRVIMFMLRFFLCDFARCGYFPWSEGCSSDHISNTVLSKDTENSSPVLSLTWIKWVILKCSNNIINLSFDNSFLIVYHVVTLQSTAHPYS